MTNGSKRIHSVLLAAGLGLQAAVASAVSPKLPESVAEFTHQYCLKCHGNEKPKGDLSLETISWNLTDTRVRKQWDLIFKYVAEGDMPPRKAKAPEAEMKQSFLQTLRAEFARGDQVAKPGGTPPRRLNRVEYLNTVRDLFGYRMLNLPLSFPVDAPNAEFDTMPEGLFLSPAVMEGYHDMATLVANRFAPLPSAPVYKSNYEVPEIGGDAGRRWFSKGKESLQFTGFNIAGWSGALWDSLFVAPVSGVYRVRLLANAQAKQGADGQPLRLGFYAFDPTEEQLPKRFRRERATLVAEINVPTGKPAWIECDVPIEAGETLHIYCDNRFPENRFPGGDLNRNQITQNVKAAIRDAAPTVELRGLAMEGPVAVLPRVKQFFGEWPPQVNRQVLTEKLLPIATRAYRRALTPAEEDQLISAVLRHGKAAGKPEFAWHYAVRRILCSPAFLYRENGHALDDYAIASRLSYFLWSTLPDDELTQLAIAGKLRDPKTLKAQTHRLLKDPRADRFIKHFTGQWLGNREMASINVCDNRYEWDDNVRYGFVRSTEMFFEEILRRNLPITTFIDSDFTYANSAMQAVWKMKLSRDKTLNQVATRQRQSLVWPEPQRLDLSKLPPGTPAHLQGRGGVLGLPGVLTVTGDGVESSPILRGVWVLENLFGQHPPPPPKDVPAQDIDTSQAKGILETLKAHTRAETCAKCHRDIDPLGLALENYDAAGGWRSKYLGSKGKLIDASAVLPGGIRLDGPVSIKQYLLKNPRIFTRCLLIKLLEYGAGRSLTIGDQQIVEQLVKQEPSAGYRFQDLIEAAVASEVFLTQ